MAKFEQLKLIIPYWNHIWQSRFVLLVMLNILQIPNKLYLMEHFIQTSGDSMNQGIGTLSFQKIGGEGGV